MIFSFLGLGNMGAPLAMNLVKAGGELKFYTRRKDCAKRFEDAGAKAVENIGQLAGCDVLCTCLPKPDDVVEIVTGKDGLYGKMRPGAIHVDFSTIDPATGNRLAAEAAGFGLKYVQATVSKTPAVAAAGEAPLFVGGDKDAIERLWPILLRVGRPHDLKTVTASCALKLLSNLIGMSNVALVAEGLNIGQGLGLDGGEVLELLLDTGCASYQMKVRGPWMLEQDFKARFSVDLAAKDLRLGCAMAEDLGFRPGLMWQTLHYLEDAHSKGLGEEDVSALYKIMKQGK